MTHPRRPATGPATDFPAAGMASCSTPAPSRTTCPWRCCALFELQAERWRRLDGGLKDLAVMAAAASIGCAWCLDFGYWEATVKHDVPAEKIRAVPAW